jgi:hypothetical protein
MSSTTTPRPRPRASGHVSGRHRTTNLVLGLGQRRSQRVFRGSPHAMTMWPCLKTSREFGEARVVVAHAGEPCAAGDAEASGEPASANVELAVETVSVAGMRFRATTAAACEMKSAASAGQLAYDTNPTAAPAPTGGTSSDDNNGNGEGMDGFW